MTRELIADNFVGTIAMCRANLSEMCAQRRLGRMGELMEAM